MRKHFAPILLLLMTASIALSVQKLDEWIKYTSPEGRYIVSLPAEPKLATQQASTANGEKFPQYMASVIEPEIAFFVSYFDFVPGTIFSADAARDGMVKAVDGTLMSESAISLGGYPGRELKVLTRGKQPASVEYMVHARLYEADKRVYVLQFIFPRRLEGEALAGKANKYFDSFQVLKN
ncbi:MAG: hypothetical protein LC775_13440 [Acidobacteria bacterium]|nr:hypothetical protein [Acidobacteriota bacterium]